MIDPVTGLLSGFKGALVVCVVPETSALKMSASSLVKWSCGPHRAQKSQILKARQQKSDVVQRKKFQHETACEDFYLYFFLFVFFLSNLVTYI